MLLHSRVSISVSLSKEIFLFLENNETSYVLSFGANERTKENIHPIPSFPYIGRLNTGNRRNRRFPSVKVSRDTACILKTRKLE